MPEPRGDAPTLEDVPEFLLKLDSATEREEGIAGLAKLISGTEGESADLLADFLRESGALEVIVPLCDDDEPAALPRRVWCRATLDGCEGEGGVWAAACGGRFGRPSRSEGGAINLWLCSLDASVSTWAHALGAARGAPGAGAGYSHRPARREPVLILRTYCTRSLRFTVQGRDMHAASEL